MKLSGKTALITGAASGIGRALALALAGHGCHLALVDIDAAGLEVTSTLIMPKSSKLSRHVLDVSDRKALARLPAIMEQTHGGIDLLINNAGVAMGGTFDRVSETDFDWLMAINFEAVVCLTRYFLPQLHSRTEARIVNISSLYGLVAPAEQSAYSASKYAVRGFSMALAHELEGSSVGVTVVHPGGVATQIAIRAKIPAGATPAEIEEKQAHMRKLLRLAPEKAAATIIKGIRHKRRRVLVGTDAKVMALIERLLPVGYWKVMKKLAG